MAMGEKYCGICKSWIYPQKDRTIGCKCHTQRPSWVVYGDVTATDQWHYVVCPHCQMISGKPQHTTKAKEKTE